MKITVRLASFEAATIIDAEHASFYGIFGDTDASHEALRICDKVIKETLEDNGIEWDWFQVLDAHSIDTTGTKIPYLAEITAYYEPIDPI